MLVAGGWGTPSPAQLQEDGPVLLLHGTARWKTRISAQNPLLALPMVTRAGLSGIPVTPKISEPAWVSQTWGGRGIRPVLTSLEDVAYSCARGGSGWTSGRISPRKGSPSVGTAAQVGDGVPIPGGVEEMIGRVQVWSVRGWTWWSGRSFPSSQLRDCPSAKLGRAGPGGAAVPAGSAPAGPGQGRGRQGRPGPMTGAIRAAGSGVGPASAALAGSRRDRALPPCAVSDRARPAGDKRRFVPEPRGVGAPLRPGVAPPHPSEGWEGQGAPGRWGWSPSVLPFSQGEAIAVPILPLRAPRCLAAFPRGLGWKSSLPHRPAVPRVPGVWVVKLCPRSRWCTGCAGLCLS